MQRLNLFIYTETSLHAGTGSTVGVVDLPIQRERTTNYPLVQGSGLKGALRSQSNLNGNDKNILFGSEDAKNAKAGAISVGDAKIVLFPVRSLMGVFAYVTCPHVLARLVRDVQGLPTLKNGLNDQEAFVTNNSQVKAGSDIVLEEFTFTAKVDADATAIAGWLADNALPQGQEYTYWRNKVKTSLVILPDNAFTDFVTTSTEVVTRIKIDAATKTVATKTVATGALWTQESLPSDTLLMSNVIVTGRGDVTPQNVIGAFASRIQIGGDETTGDGFVALKWL